MHIKTDICIDFYSLASISFLIVFCLCFCFGFVLVCTQQHTLHMHAACLRACKRTANGHKVPKMSKPQKGKRTRKAAEDEEQEEKMANE